MTRYKMMLVVLTMMACLVSPGIAGANVYPLPFQVPIPNMATMIDLGSSMCTPCQRMMPILNQLQMEYQGRVAIVYIDVDEYDGLDKQFDASIVPTQIFFDHAGKEVYRHEGFFSRESIINILTQMGFPPMVMAPQAVPYQMVYPSTTP